MNERRRRLLATAGTAIAAGLAGCAGADEDEDGADTTTETTDATTETPTETTTTTTGTTETTTAETTTTTETTETTDTTTETTTTTTVSEGPAALTIDNVRSRAWTVERDTGSVAPTGESNPTMTFEVGRRYEVRNDAWRFHPFAFRAADDTRLLSQDADGTFEDDDAVDWVDDSETFAFTMTPALADAVAYYRCEAHSSMRGPVETA